MSTWELEDGIVQLPDGTRIRGTGVMHERQGVLAPDFAVYLLDQDPGVTEWPYRWVRWPDFDLPADTDDAIEALRGARQRARSERVEIACGAGIGRTGTAVAVLAMMSGIKPDDVVAWVRRNYHPHAVETQQQQEWITDVTARLRL